MSKNDVNLAGHSCLRCGMGHYEGYENREITTPCAMCGHRLPDSMPSALFRKMVEARDAMIKDGTQPEARYLKQLLAIAQGNPIESDPSIRIRRRIVEAIGKRKGGAEANFIPGLELALGIVAEETE